MNRASKTARLQLNDLTRRGAFGIFRRRQAPFSPSGAAMTRPSATMRIGGSTDASADATIGDGSSSADGASADSSACEVSPEGEIGPYFADDSDPRFNRGNIPFEPRWEQHAGPAFPLTLSVFILDVKNGCKPYVNAQVDIWHCNSAGIYSDQAVENTTTETWLRGYQLTDANGKVTFTTIVPGWYSGRTTHIHLRVRSTYSKRVFHERRHEHDAIVLRAERGRHVGDQRHALQRRGKKPHDERVRSRLFG